MDNRIPDWALNKFYIQPDSLTFDDVLIRPHYSELNSRKDVSLRGQIGSFNLDLPVLSANMDTVTSTDMCVAMHNAGGLGVLHRFWPISSNVEAYLEVTDRRFSSCAVSVGIGVEEMKRARQLYEVGARTFVLDVAHGAQKQVADQYMTLKGACPDASFIVGNFATHNSIGDFILKGCGFKHISHFPDMFKIGIGPGSACTTRIKTGVGVPQLTALLECSKLDIRYIADGGMRVSGDIAKALAAGASGVMLGRMLAGTKETPPYKVEKEILDRLRTSMNQEELAKAGLAIAKEPGELQYRGSASKESYDVQGKDQSYITAEGESFTVPYKGSVSKVLSDIEGGLRSSFTYVGARDLDEFKKKAQFVRVTSSTVVENHPHGKKVSV